MTAYATIPPQGLAPGDILILFGKQANIALSSATRTAGVVTFTTSAAHHLIPGFQFTAVGVGSPNGTQFNGLYQILSVPTSTTLTAQPLEDGPAGATGYNKRQPNDNGGAGGLLVATQAELLNAVVPIASIAAALPAGSRSSGNFGVTMEVFFDGAPGAFSLQLQEGNLEGPGGNASGYVTPSQAAYTITTVNANNYASTDLIPTGGAFLRALLNSLTNNVGIIVRLRRVQ